MQKEVLDAPMAFNVLTNMSIQTGARLFELTRILNTINGYNELFQFNRICLSYIGTGIIIPGIIFNLLILIVLQKQRGSSSTLYYLKSLAVFEMILLGLFFCNHSIFWFLKGNVKMGKNWTLDTGLSNTLNLYDVYFCHWTGILEETVRLINVWLITSLSADKYFGICHPYFASSRCTPSATKKAIISVICLAALCKLPRFFESKIVADFNGRLRFSSNFSPEHHTKYTFYYRIWMSNIIEFLIPFTLLVFMNSRTVWALNQFRGSSFTTNDNDSRAFGSNRDDQRARRNVTVVCTVITITFLVFQMPFYFTAVYGIVTRGACNHPPAEIKMENLNRDFPNLPFQDDTAANVSTNNAAASSFFLNESLITTNIDDVWGFSFCKFDFKQFKENNSKIANLTGQMIDWHVWHSKKNFLNRIWLQLNISHIGLMIVSSVNFFIYLTLSSGFRHTLFQIIENARDQVMEYLTSIRLEQRWRNRGNGSDGDNLTNNRAGAGLEIGQGSREGQIQEPADPHTSNGFTRNSDIEMTSFLSRIEESNIQASVISNSVGLFIPPEDEENSAEKTLHSSQSQIDKDCCLKTDKNCHFESIKSCHSDSDKKCHSDKNGCIKSLSTQEEKFKKIFVDVESQNLQEQQSNNTTNGHEGDAPKQPVPLISAIV